MSCCVPSVPRRRGGVRCATRTQRDLGRVGIWPRDVGAPRGWYRVGPSGTVGNRPCVLLIVQAADASDRLAREHLQRQMEGRRGTHGAPARKRSERHRGRAMCVRWRGRARRIASRRSWRSGSGWGERRNGTGSEAPLTWAARVWSLADGLGSVREKADVSPEKMGVGLEACARARGSPPSVRRAGIRALLESARNRSPH